MFKRRGQNVLRIGSPGSGKTLATAYSILHADGAEVILDPHPDSLAQAVLTHVTGNVLYENLSDIQHTLGFELLAPSNHPDLRQRTQDNTQRAETFTEILLRRRNADSMASTPLMEEWVLAALMLWLFQAKKKPLTWLPSAFTPDTDEFRALLKDCLLPEFRHKFTQLATLSMKALRAEVGSAMRLVNSVFRSPAFQQRCRGGFDFGAFLQKKGKLLVERGRGVGSDTMRVIMGAIILLTRAHAESRPMPTPTIRIRIDEAVNAGLASKGVELQGAAETNKWGLYWEFDVQKLDFPGGADDVLQLCHRHEWYRCDQYELARKAATDIVPGLGRSETPRAQRIADIADEIMNFEPGWRYVRDKRGSRREYVPLLEDPWPDWPGLREAKRQEKLQWIYSRMEYRVPDEEPSSRSSEPEMPPPDSSPDASSPATRLKQLGRKRVDGSQNSSDASASS